MTTRSRLGRAAAFCALLASCAPAAPALRPGADAPPPSSVQLVWQEVNEARRRAGCVALEWSDAAAAAARAHSEDMARRGYFSHVTPEGLGPAERLTAAGVAWSGVAENIARTSGQSSVVELWLGSAGHRANILNCTYTATGIGEAAGRWTQLFYAPARR